MVNPSGSFIYIQLDLSEAVSIQGLAGVCVIRSSFLPCCNIPRPENMYEEEEGEEDDDNALSLDSFVYSFIHGSLRLLPTPKLHRWGDFFFFFSYFSK